MSIGSYVLTISSAFVEYVNPSAAKLAMDQVNEKLWGSSTIHIDWANDRKNATSAAAPPAYTQAEMPTVGAMAPSNEPVSPTLFVGNLPTDLDRAGIYSLFARFGEPTIISDLTHRCHSRRKIVDRQNDRPSKRSRIC